MRVIIDRNPMDASYNMAVDEAILRLKTPTLRMYCWKPPAISLGYFQSLKLEVDSDACKKHGVDIVRRITGGGAVFHDSELTYSFIVPLDMVSDNIIESYRKICGAVVKGLKELGADAEFAPINDIIAGKKKISGSAQTRRYGGVLQHGTILLDVDVDRMFELLLVPDEKLKGKLIADVKERVTSLHHLGLKNDFDIVAQAIQKGFSEEFGLDFEPDGLTEEEKELAQQLVVEKFGNPEWIEKR